MEEDCATASVSDRSTVLPDSKSERAGFGFEEKSELERKRFKLQPFSAQGTWKNNEVESAKEGISNVSKETLVTKTNFNQSIGIKPDRSLDRLPLALNTKFTAENSKISGQNIKSNTEFAKPKHFVLDLNEQDASSSINKSSEHINSKDAVECESSVGTFEPKDPMKVWKEMKQNGFLSASNSGMPAPKPRGRKSKTDVFKKKIELAKKEQVDRFAKVAAPSGLLNGLNPGIINHVRNSKQVHSIIEALVRSEERENRRAKNASKDCNEKKGQENLSDIGMKRIFAHYGNGLGILDDKVAMKMSASSTNVASEISSSLSNEDSRNLTADSALSIKAANVAFQWLELLHQDIKGRLTALRRSKKRVRAVIETELPFLMSKEFSSENQENEPCNIMRTSDVDNKAAQAHRARWSPLFDQMEKALCEEECQLDSWLNQVKEMKLQCGNGLYQHLNTTENGWTRVEKVDNHDADLAISAAAASIYSTCNFLQSMENIPCL
jgi:hypothetical protein